jgi:proteasome lid subunit RPN8/RPN11
MRQTPPVKGAVSVKPFEKGKGPGFKIRRIEETPPPKKSMTDFGITPKENDKNAKVKVLIPQALQKDLCFNRPLSHEVEEGGFLLGRVFQDTDVEGSYLVELSIAPNAEYTGASFFHFTFTGDSFVGIKKKLQQRPNEKVLGWFHTHLFPATTDMGLTSIDFTLHFGTFTFPWQVAGLINIDGSHRTLRFYVRDNNNMILCPYWVIV